jgi:hypothetical protein
VSVVIRCGHFASGFDFSVQISQYGRVGFRVCLAPRPPHPPPPGSQWPRNRVVFELLYNVPAYENRIGSVACCKCQS